MSRRKSIWLISATLPAAAAVLVLQVLSPPFLHFMSRWAVMLAWAGGLWLGWMLRDMRR